MSGRWMIGREAAPLACTLSLALLAAAAAPGHAQSTGTKPAAEQTQPAATAATPRPTAQSQPAATAPTTAAAAKSTASAPTTGTKTATAAATSAPKATAAKKSSASVARTDSTTAAATTPSRSKKKAGATASTTVAAAADSSQASDKLRGGQEGTVFKSLTVEGEDRVHIDFERPELKLDLDLEKAPGLDWGSAADVLNRTTSDLRTPLVQLSAKQANPYLARPWLSEFATGPVARFHPDAQGVERWKLVVVDSKGAAVKTFAGKGDPPRDIDWDGRATDGTPVTPGRTYSYVFEAYDKAGNKRNVVGQGFAVAAYRIDAPEGPTLLFSASELRSAAGAAQAPAAPGGSETPAAPPILLEAASWLNQSERLSQAIRVTATARSQEQADQLAGTVQRTLAPLVLGDPARVAAVSLVVADAPEAGTLAIAPGK